METELISGKRTNVIERGVVVLEDNEISLIVFFFFFFFSPFKKARHDVRVALSSSRRFSCQTNRSTRDDRSSRFWDKSSGLWARFKGQREDARFFLSLSFSLFFNLPFFIPLFDLSYPYISRERERDVLRISSLAKRVPLNASHLSCSTPPTREKSILSEFDAGLDPLTPSCSPKTRTPPPHSVVHRLV